MYEGNQFAIIALNGTRVTGTDSYRLDYNVDIEQKDWYEELIRNGKYVEAGEGSDKGIYRNHPEWNMTIYYVVHDYNTLERTGFMVITIPLKISISCLIPAMKEPGLPWRKGTAGLSVPIYRIIRIWKAGWKSCPFV